MNIPSIFWLSAAAAGVAVIGFVLVHRVIKPNLSHLDQHQGFIDAMLSIVGTLVSILLGLLVAAALDHYQQLERSVDTEAACLSQVFRLTVGLPNPSRGVIQALTKKYGDQVVAIEWDTMGHGQASPEVMVTYFKLVNAVVNFRPVNDGESNLHAALLSSVQQVGDARRERILALHSVWINHLMPVLLMCSAIVLAFAYLYVRQGAVFHAVLICLVAVALGGNIGLVFLLSNPFSGDWKIQPRGFLLNNRALEIIRNEVQQNPEVYRNLMPGVAPKASSDAVKFEMPDIPRNERVLPALQRR